MFNSPEIRIDLNQIVAKLMPYHPIKIILFGSYARGDMHEGSDIDLAILKNTEKRFVERISEVMEYIDVQIPVEAIVYTEAEFSKLLQENNAFVKKILEEGKVLYEQ